MSTQRSGIAPAIAAAIVAALSACTPSARSSTSVDAIASLPPTADARALARIEAARALVLPGSEVRIHERLGVPTFLWASPDGAVAGLAALGGGASAMASAGAGLAGTAEAAARAHLGVYGPLYGLDAADVATAAVAHVHDIGRGPVVVQFQQTIGGIEVFRERASVVMDRALRLVAIGGFLSGAGAQAFAPAIGSALGAADAAAAALSDLGSTAIDAGALSSLGMGEGGYELLATSAAPAGDPIRARRIWFHGPAGLVPAWYVEAEAAQGGRTVLYAHAIAAGDGAVLFRTSLTSDAESPNNYTYRVWAAPAADVLNPAAPFDGPQGNAFDPHPSGLVDGTPLPGAVPQVDVTLMAGPRFDDAWLPLGAIETTGNNVEAYADLVAPDGFTPGSADFHAGVTGPSAFQRTYDTALPNAPNQMQAALTQMFYNVNFWHDWYYLSGFTEAAGNAQANNYGRGGVGGDSIRAEGEDFSGRNNANMNTPADGGRPRMQMFLFDGIADRHLFLGGAMTGDLATGVPSGFGIPSHDVSAAVVWVDDGVGSTAYPPATTTTATVHDGCDFTPPTGGGSWAAVAGKIAFIDRGGVPPPGVPTCGFSDKAFNAQRAGAVGVLIASTTPHAAATAVTMGPATTPPPVITIPVYQLGTPDGDAVRAALGSGLVTARLLRATAVDRDGTIDDQIMAHEWGHYISNRLVANSSGLTTNMARGLGEGWADFHAMLLTVKEEDALVPSNPSYAGVYGLALWSTTGGANGPIPNQGVYFGIRRMPYSTDLTRNNQTFKNIQDNSPIPVGVPFAFWPAPNTTAANGGNSEVHNTGEVWATMLWECYAALLRDTVLGAPPRLSFAAARERMKDYLVAAYQITPPQPTLLEARDALLAAAYAGGDLFDYHAFLTAFAKRGAGAGAIAPDRFSATNNGVVESFVTGVDIAFVGASIVDDVTSCDHDGILDSGETGHLRVTLRNDTTLQLAATSAVVTAIGTNATNVFFPGGNVLSFGATNPLETVTATLPITLAAGLAGEQPIDLQLSYGDPALALPDVTTTWSARGNVDDVLAQAQVDDVESSQPRFTAVTLGNTAPTPLTGWQRKELTAFQHVYSVADQNGLTDLTLVSPAMVAGAGRLGMTFRHRYNFEFSGATLFDGGVVELSADGGNTWTDVGGLATGQAYTGALNGGTTLGTRRAFAAISPGYPAFVTSSVDLGTAFAGQTVRVRFRVATDANGRANGWDVDDIAFTGLVTRPFPALLPNKCNTGASQPNRVPTAAIAAVAPVAERTLVSLAGSGADADGDALTFRWSQLSGPPVTFSDATSPTPTFVAPDVPAGGGTVVVALLAFDGTAFSGAVSRSIPITNLDRPPVADAGAAQTVTERSLVQLAGAGADADGEPVTFAWTQTAGPPVALLDATGATASFLAPEVTTIGASLSFQLAVTAGGVTTASSTQVQVTNVNQAPIASAGAGKLVDEGALVQLDGSGTDADGDAVTYAWTQVSPASPVLALSDATAAVPTFAAPQVGADTAFTFRLVVSDAVAQSAASVVTVVVRDLVRAPTANAGAAQSVDERTPVQLSGGGTDPDGRTLSFLWAQTSGPPVALSDATAASPSFTAPDVGPGGAVLAFQLVVSAGSATATSTTSVSVRDVNRGPVAAVGPDLHTTSGLEVTLDARSSADPDGQSLGYSWSQVSGPAVTLAAAATARPTFTAPPVTASTELVFEVIVADGQGGIASARQSVTVEPASSGGGGGKSSGGCSTGGGGSIGLLGLLGIGLRAMSRPHRRRSKAP